MSRRRLIFLAVSAVLLVALAVALRIALRRTPAATGRLVLSPASFGDLPGWRNDKLSRALPALLRSCRRLGFLPDGEPLGGGGFAGTAGDWRGVCAAAGRVRTGDDDRARAFFEQRFRPWTVFDGRDGGERTGLFTGYYEALLHGSRKRTTRFRVPLFRRPPELVTVDLGKFREDLRGRRLAGRVSSGALIPLPDRAAIMEGALAGRGLELLWVDSPIDAFFLQIQGSGRVRLAEGGEVRVGYAADNGRPYTAIGRELVRRGLYRPEEVSMQTIRRWLEGHSGQADALLATDASYVFFEEAKGEGPLGADGVPLTPGRSLAVDRQHWPLGVPLWLDGAAPDPREGAPDRPLQRLFIAQDTGGAIRGPIRGDVFWGSGPVPEAVAGKMKTRGRLWVLLPREMRGPVP